MTSVSTRFFGHPSETKWTFMVRKRRSLAEARATNESEVRKMKGKRVATKIYRLERRAKRAYSHRELNDEILAYYLPYAGRRRRLRLRSRQEGEDDRRHDGRRGDGRSRGDRRRERGSDG